MGLRVSGRQSLPGGVGKALQYRVDATTFGGMSGADYDEANNRVRFINPFVFRSGANEAIVKCTPTAARTITLPDATTTLVGKDTTDTLTNKTIDVADNVLTAPGAANGDLLSFSSGRYRRLIKGEVYSALMMGGDGTPGFSYIVDNNISNDARISASKVVADPTINGLRLSLQSGVPIPTADISGATAIYLTPYKSGAIALFDGASWILRTTAQVLIVFSPVVANNNYDVFAYWNGSAVKLELSAAWTSDTVRSTALARQNGVLVKAVDPTRRYLGTFRATASNTTEDSVKKRFLWNVDNRVVRLLAAYDTTSYWSYNSRTWRQARASSANQVEFVNGDVAPVSAHVSANWSSTTAGNGLLVAVGVDSTSSPAPVPKQFVHAQFTGGGSIVYGSDADYDDVLDAGYHRLVWLECTHSANADIFGPTSSVIGPNIQGSGLRARLGC